MLNPNGKSCFFFYEDSSIVKILPKTIEHAYLAILDDDLKTAAAVFSRIDSPRAKWGEVLIQVLKGNLSKYPTYFQIRNFYEIDLDFLLKNEKIHDVEQLLGALEIFSPINQEVYKYAARAMYENRLYSAALRYMEKSKKIYYNDAELHFMLAKYYLRINDIENAQFYIDVCLELIPKYYPAEVLKHQIECKWF